MLILSAVASMIRAYIGETAFFDAFGALYALLFACAVYCAIAANARLKTAVRSARHGAQNIVSACLPSWQARAADAPAFGCMAICWFVCCKNICPTFGERRGGALLFNPLARFVFLSLFTSLLFCLFCVLCFLLHYFSFLPCFLSLPSLLLSFPFLFSTFLSFCSFAYFSWLSYS